VPYPRGIAKKNKKIDHEERPGIFRGLSRRREAASDHLASDVARIALRAGVSRGKNLFGRNVRHLTDCGAEPALARLNG